MRNQLFMTTILAGNLLVFPAAAYSIKEDNIELNTIFKDGIVNESISSASGQPYTGFFTSDNISVTPVKETSTAVQAYYGGGVVFKGKTVNFVGANGLIAWDKGSKIIVEGDDITIVSTADGDLKYGIQAQNQGKVSVTGKNIDITAKNIGVQVANGTKGNQQPLATLDLTADNINITGGAAAVSAMSYGIATLEGNVTLKGKNAIFVRGDASVFINKSGEHTVKMDGDINFNYEDKTSGAAIDALVDVTLNGKDSYWKGNTVVQYENAKPSEDKLKVTGSTITLKNGAIWEATPITDDFGDTKGFGYVALNNLKIENGTVNILDANHGISVDNINATDGIITGGVLNVNNNMTVSGDLTIDNVTSGDGIITFNEGTVLNVKQGITRIENEVKSKGTVVYMALAAGTKSIEMNDIFTNENNLTDEYDNLVNITLADNLLYKFVQRENDLSFYEVEQKPITEVADSLGVSKDDAGAILAAVSGGEADGNEAFNNIVSILNEAAQKGDGAAISDAANLGADSNPVVRTVETDLHNMVFAAVSDELSGADGAIAISEYEDAPFKRIKVWARGLFNYLDKEKTSKARGFDADIRGVAFGLDKQIDRAVKLGVGYAYNEADVSSQKRSTDVDTHTAFVYGQYKPSDWYVNTIAAYNWSDYDEKKSVLGYNNNAKYDVKSLGVSVMSGYEMKRGGVDLTPEAGMRYAHIAQDSYSDRLGNHIGSNDSDILTAVAGIKAGKAFMGGDMTIRPEVRAALTYDLVDDGNNANVILANGAAYRVNGEKLERLGFELGAKVASEVADNFEVAAGWEGRFRKDYNDQTILLNAKFMF